MQKLSNTHFPITKTSVRFKLSDGTILNGRYDFNNLMMRRWIDSDGNEYTSDLVDSWEEDWGLLQMNERDIELLKNALELYSFTIEQRRENRYDNEESSDFYYMRKRLSEIIGVDVT